MIQTFYFVYKTTNLINGKIYIGKHITKRLNDRYVGSGKLLKRAINKYGREHFEFQILEWFEDELSMNNREAELVTEDFCLRDDTYNLCVGGKGGFSYINRERINNVNKDFNDIKAKKRQLYGKVKRPENSIRLKEQHRLGLRPKVKPQVGGNVNAYSDEANQKRSRSMTGRFTGSASSQFGTFWITNGIENKKLKSVDVITDGWYKGRVINK